MAGFRIEHVAQKPRGWRVRTVVPGRHAEHRVRVAFPPGPRRTGTGRVLQILHPRGEHNPECQINPGELLIFGNPSFSSSEIDELMQLWHTARIPLGGAAPRYERLKWAANEWEKTHPGQRLKAYKQLEHATRGYGNPSKGQQLSVPEKHQLKIARDTLRMSDAMAGVMGGPTKEQAREIIRRLTGKKNPYFSETLTKGSRQVVIWANESEGPFHVQPYVNNGETPLRQLTARPVRSLDTARRRANMWLEAMSREGVPTRGNATKLEQQRAARERAARIRGARLNPSLDEIRHGDKVTILVPAGIGRGGQEWKRATGRAVMRGPHGWVLNMGGAHGRPAVATENNLVSVRKGNPAMDAFTRKHLKNWLQSSVHSSERRHVGALIRRYVAEYPEVLAESRSWPEIHRLAESEYGGRANPSRYQARQLAREGMARRTAVKLYRRMGELSAAGKIEESNKIRMRLARINQQMGWVMADVAEFAAGPLGRNPDAAGGWKHFTKYEKNFLRRLGMPAPKDAAEVQAYKEAIKKIDEINLRYRGNPEQRPEFVCPHCEKQFTAAEVEAGKFREHMAEHRAQRETKKNPKREQLKKRIKALEAQFYPAMDRLAAARRAGGVMSPEYMAIEKETDKLGRELDTARRMHAAAFNPLPGRIVATVEKYTHESAKPGQHTVTLHRHAGGKKLFMESTVHPSLEVAKRVAAKKAQEVELSNPSERAKIRAFFDPAVKKWVAAVYHSKAGNLFRTRETKAEAIAALKEEIARLDREPFRRNPPEHIGDHRGHAMYYEGISYNAPSLKLRGYSTDLALRRAIDRKLRAIEKKQNPDELMQAVQLYQSFHGKDPKEIVDEHVSAAVRLDYTALGDLEYLKVITPIGQKVEFHFEDDAVKLASSPDGRQLYCIGGNQDLRSCLDKDSLEKDFIDLGEAIEVQYLARKVHGHFQPVSYYHEFGEARDGSTKPQLMFDKIKKQIFFVGGEYWIDTSKGVSPGIEN